MNIANFIQDNAQKYPDKQAVIARASGGFFSFGKSSNQFESCSYDELDKRSNVYANAFVENGITQGTKTLVFVTPNLDFAPIIFALFKVGAIPVFIDPGMGLESMLSCVQSVEAEALIGISKVQYLRNIKRKYFSHIKTVINVDGNFWGTLSLSKIAKNQSNQFEILEKEPSDLAAILFTSGGTGRPKGVEYTMGMFWKQTVMLKEAFRLTPSDKDYPGFPLFSLFTLALGLTTHICDFDASKPAQSNPKKILKDLLEYRITFGAGSPSIWKNVAEHCLKKKQTLPLVKTLALFGAPVRYELLEKLVKVFPNANIYTPYGATECLPVSLTSAHEVLGETKELRLQGKGVCVGYPLKGVEVQIIPMVDEKVENLSITGVLPAGEIGEIIVKSPTTTPGYHLKAEATELIQIKDEQGYWHRMGDVGLIDEWNRLWFLGRKSHVVKTDERMYYPTAVEAIFNEHNEVENCALIEVNGKPALAVLRKDKKISLSIDYQEKFFSELEILGQKYQASEGIQKYVLFEEFPVDTRHNIKIDRKKLSELAHQRLNQEVVES